MKFTRLTRIALIVFAAAATQAAPVPKNKISAEANWFLHADIDQFKQTGVGKYVLEQLAQPDAQSKIDAFKAVIGFDFTKSLHGLTIFGLGNKPEDGVLLVSADFDADRLVTLAKSAKEYTNSLHGKYTIHSWVDENKNQRTYGAIADGSVIFGQKLQRIEDVLDVINGTKPNLKAASAYQKLGVTETSAVLLGAARQTTLPEDNPAAAMLKNVTALSFAAFETNADIQAELQLSAANEETTRQILSVNQGLIALMALQNDKSDIAKLARGLSVVQSGNAVNITLKLPVANSIQMLKDADAKKKK